LHINNRREGSIDKDRMDICEEFGRRLSLDLYKGNHDTHHSIAQAAVDALVDDSTDREGFLEVSITDLGLSTAMTNPLTEDLDILVVGDLLDATVDRLFATPGIGTVTIQSLLRSIIRLGKRRDQQWKTKLGMADV
jgi:hypothetical protein